MIPSRWRRMADREQPKLAIVRQCAPCCRMPGSAGGEPPQHLLPSQGGIRRGPAPIEVDGPAVPGPPSTGRAVGPIMAWDTELRPRCSTSSRLPGRRSLVQGNIHRGQGQYYWQEHQGSHLILPN